jgi:hypothetical protein
VPLIVVIEEQEEERFTGGDRSKKKRKKRNVPFGENLHGQISAGDSPEGILGFTSRKPTRLISLIISLVDTLARL